MGKSDKKLFAFCARWQDKKSVTVVEVEDRFQLNTSIDVIESGSLKSAVRVFNQRHTVLAWGKLKPKYTIFAD